LVLHLSSFQIDLQSFGFGLASAAVAAASACVDVLSAERCLVKPDMPVLFIAGVNGAFERSRTRIEAITESLRAPSSPELKCQTTLRAAARSSLVMPVDNCFVPGVCHSGSWRSMRRARTLTGSSKGSIVDRCCVKEKIGQGFRGPREGSGFLTILQFFS
jgi:hypothetical protein